MVYIFLNIKHQLYKELRRFLSIKVSLSYRLANTIHDAELFYFHGADSDDETDSYVDPGDNGDDDDMDDGDNTDEFHSPARE